MSVPLKHTLSSDSEDDEPINRRRPFKHSRNEHGAPRVDDTLAYTPATDSQSSRETSSPVLPGSAHTTSVVVKLSIAPEKLRECTLRNEAGGQNLARSTPSLPSMTDLSNGGADEKGIFTLRLREDPLIISMCEAIQATILVASTRKKQNHSLRLKSSLLATRLTDSEAEISQMKQKYHDREEGYRAHIEAINLQQDNANQALREELSIAQDEPRHFDRFEARVMELEGQNAELRRLLAESSAQYERSLAEEHSDMRTVIASAHNNNVLMSAKAVVDSFPDWTAEKYGKVGEALDALRDALCQAL